MWRSRISTRQKCGIFFMFPVRCVLLSNLNPHPNPNPNPSPNPSPNPNPNPNQVGPPLPLALRRRHLPAPLHLLRAVRVERLRRIRAPPALPRPRLCARDLLAHRHLGPPACRAVRAPAAVVLGALLLLCRADLRIAQLRTRRDLGRQDLQRPCRRLGRHPAERSRSSGRRLVGGESAPNSGGSWDEEGAHLVGHELLRDGPLQPAGRHATGGGRAARRLADARRRPTRVHLGLVVKDTVSDAVQNKRPVIGVGHEEIRLNSHFAPTAKLPPQPPIGGHPNSRGRAAGLSPGPGNPAA